VTISIDLYKRIRKLHLVEKRSQREISRLLGVSLNTVRKYVKGKVIPPEHKHVKRKSSLKKAVEPYIMECLEKI
jgi:predicted transcriptional regulator